METLAREIEKPAERFAKKRSSENAASLAATLRADADRLRGGVLMSDADRYLPLIYPMASALDYLPENALLLGLRKNPDLTARWKQLSLPVISSFTEWKKAAQPADLLAWRLWAQCCRLPATLPFSEKTVSL